MKITVTAPATTANLGPGFDCLGAALGLRLRLSVSTGAERAWRVTGTDDTPGPGLVDRAIEAVCPDPPPFSATMDARIPLARGLGSSAAAVAAGLLVGCALAGRELHPDELLRLGLPLEGHPDNLAPALYGGMTVVVPGPEVIRFEPAASVRPVILVPRERLPTAQARSVLPDEVARADAVANIARSSGLVALLTGVVDATPPRLIACTEDLMHQRQRAPLMPATADAIRSLRSAGVAAAVSGAGPSVVCLLTYDTRDAFEATASGMGAWKVLDVGWSLEGAEVEEVSE